MSERDFWKQYDGTSVAVIGNAGRVREFRPGLDAFSHQVRFNKGYELTATAAHSVGSRTDTLVVATSKRRTLPEAICKSLKAIVWIDTAFKYMEAFRPPWIDQHPNCYRLDNMEYLSIRDDIGVDKPSSGAMFFWLLMQHSKPAKMAVINFDWWSGPSYHWGPGGFWHPHDGETEKRFFYEKARENGAIHIE